MNRKLIVTLLRKDIQELDMITEGFMEMEVYPKAIIGLAQRKTEDIQSYIQQLFEEKYAPETTEKYGTEQEPINNTISESEIENILETPDTEDLTPKSTNNEDAIFETKITEASDHELDVDNIKDETQISTINETIEVIETTTSFTDTKIISEETKKTIIGEKIVTPTISRNELHSKTDNTFSSTIANKKISDIKQAISIGERFRFQRELFKGNGEDMNKTLNYINQLATLEEVQSFLLSKYGWENENETAEDFMQIVKRRFI